MLGLPALRDRTRAKVRWGCVANHHAANICGSALREQTQLMPSSLMERNGRGGRSAGKIHPLSRLPVDYCSSGGACRPLTRMA